ncbi:MAG: hydrolase [Flavobacteriaceae bacterium]|nr:hydrolase [Flavobacteriaceae bacterium]
MKKNIFLYLFIIALLGIIFQQVQLRKAKDTSEFDAFKVQTQENVTAYQDTIAQLNEEALDLMAFDLQFNDYALNYFENFNFDPEELMPQIRDAIYETNFYEKQHPLIPFESMVGGKIVINKVKMINHRWIVADFNDGPHWGEVLIKYFINEDKTYSFETVDALIYPPYK